MKFRTLAGEKVSQLGFGAMRLPTTGGQIDVPAAVSLIRRGLDNGINYVDTAWVYHGGESENVVNLALRDGYRNKTFVATKCPIWLAKEPGDYEKYLDQQLVKLGVECIDFYLLHSFSSYTWNECKRLDGFSFLEKAKAKGKIKHAGFSFHDEQPVFMDIISAWDKWEFCQIQYNYLDRDYQAGEKGLLKAHELGVDVIIMEPLRGGNLAQNVPPHVKKLWESSGKSWSPASWALRWIWNRHEVGTILSGMSNQEQLDDNLVTASEAAVGGLSVAELELVEKVAAAYRGSIRVGCTACKYCMPCPSGVDIPRNLGLFNEYYMFNKAPGIPGAISWIPESQRADKCTECGVCLELCPQKIDIPGELAAMRREFAAV